MEAELSHPIVWNQLRALAAQRFPDEPERWLPATPMRRWHYLYGRTTWLTDPAVFAELHEIHRRTAIDQARSIGLLDEDGPGTWTHPDLSRMVYADGKVVTPLFRGKEDTRIANRQTGEIRTPRFEADASLHFEGTGETVWGLKFVLVAVRTTDIHGRIILDTDWVPSPGGEAATALDSITRIAGDAAGLQGVIYDGALRGVHHQRLLRDLGILSVNKVSATTGTGPRRKGRVRVEKSTFVEQRTITTPDGTVRTIDLFARAGAIGIVTLTETGEKLFTELRRIRTSRKADKVGTFRWYNHYRLPEHLVGELIVVRLHGNGVFISYSKDSERVGQLATTLRQCGLRPWRDAESLGLGAATREAIRTELTECRAAMIWLTEATLASDYVTKIEIPEIYQQHKDRGLRIIPLFVDWTPGAEAEASFLSACGLEIGNHNGYPLSLEEPLQPQLFEIARRYARDLLCETTDSGRRPSLRIATRSNAAPSVREVDIDLDWTTEYPADGTLPDSATTACLHEALGLVTNEVLRAATPGPIRLFAKCHLHLGVAIGHALHRPTGMIPITHVADEEWPCVEARFEDHPPLQQHTSPGPVSSNLASIEVSISRDTAPGVQQTIAATGTRYHSRVSLQPAAGPGQLALASPEQNNAWAAQIADEIRALAATPGITTIDLYLAAPLQFAVALGWRLNAAGNLRIFNWQDPAGPYLHAWSL